MGLNTKFSTWLDELVDRFLSWFDKIDAEMDDIEAVFDDEEAQKAEDKQEDCSSSPEPSPAPSAASKKYPLGIASCWHGANASERMMNVLSPKMSEEKFKTRLKFMTGKGCTAAHVILANGGDGECAGYAGWNDADLPVMLLRVQRLRDAGLVVIPWIIADDSKDLLHKLFADPAKLIGKMRGLLKDVPYVVLGLEMDEGGNSSQWKSVRDAVKKVYSGPIGVHHTSGNSFPFASLGDIILGQLNPGCSEAQVKNQIKAILAKGKKAVGFEYSRGPDRKLSLAALEAGAEGVGNWDGGDLPTTKESSAIAPAQTAQSSPEDAVDFGQLDFCWGGFKGGSAKLDAKARILNLSVSSSGMSYKWLSGGCENLGATSKDDYKHTVACLFCLVGGKWRGGKFDWISTSRTTRDFKNITEGYVGWDREAVGKADKFAFVIIGADGKRRTNVISCGR